MELKGDKSILIAIVIGIMVFGGVFLILRDTLQAKEHLVNGVLIYADNPRAQIAAAFAQKNVVEHIGVASEDESLPGRSAAAAEIASALAISGKNLTIQGIVRGEYCVNQNRERIACQQPNVLVNYSTCNCVRVENGVVKVLGTDTWMLETGSKMRGVINWALAKE